MWDDPVNHVSNVTDVLGASAEESSPECLVVIVVFIVSGIPSHVVLGCFRASAGPVPGWYWAGTRLVLSWC